MEIDVKERVRQNQELLMKDPVEYLRRLREVANTFVGQMQSSFLTAADELEEKLRKEGRL